MQSLSSPLQRGQSLNVKLFLFDVDGVLTDGKLYYTERGETIKVFNVRDGLAIKLLKDAGIRVGAISSRDSEPLLRRLKELNLDEIHLGERDKLKVFKNLLKKYSLKGEEVCFVGDDLVDIPVLKRVGLPVSVPDAPKEVKRFCKYITKSRGGEGVIREVAEKILKEMGLWERVIGSFMER